MKRLLAILVVAPLLAAAVQPNFHRYRHRVLGKEAITGSAAAATFGTLRNHPHEWGKGPAGFAKRFASHMGQHAIKSGIEMGVAGIRHENLHYQRSNLHGTWPRMKYAVVHTFIVPRTNKPGKTVAVSRISGNIGAGLISRAWQPASAAGLGAGLASGGIGIGAEVGANMAREFWPRKHARVRKLSSRRHASTHA